MLCCRLNSGEEDRRFVWNICSICMVMHTAVDSLRMISTIFFNKL
jgi:hypothetical protein